MTRYGSLAGLLCATLLCSNAGGQDTAWFHPYTNTNADCNGVHRTSFGDLIITGDFLNDHPFDGQQPEWYGYNDGYVGRTDRMGNMRWIHAIGAHSNDDAGPVREIGGRITLSGWVNNWGGSSSIQYNGTATPITAGGAYIMQVDTAGSLLWLQQHYVGGDDFEVDGAGNIHFTVVWNGWRYYRKVDINGNMLAQFVVTDKVHCDGLAIGPTGDIWVAGSMTAMNADTTTWAGQSYAMQAWDSDIFLARFDTAGTPLFVTRIGGAGEDVLHDLAITSDGMVHLSGTLSGTAAIGNDTLPGSSPRWFLASFDPSGSLIALDDTSFLASGTNGGIGGQLRTNDAGEVFASLNFQGMLFHGTDTLEQSPLFSPAGILAKWDALGQLSWYRSYGNDTQGRINAYVTLGSIVEDSVFIGGRTSYAAYTALVIDSTYAPLSTSVPTHAAANDRLWQAYPNPTTGRLTVTNTMPGNRMQLIDPMGNVLLDRRSMGREEHLDLAAVPAGCYILRVDDAMGASSARVIVLR